MERRTGNEELRIESELASGGAGFSGAMRDDMTE